MKHLRVIFHLKTGYEREFILTEDKLAQLSRTQPNAEKWVSLPNKFGGATMLRDEDITMVEAFPHIPDSGER